MLSLFPAVSTAKTVSVYYNDPAVSKEVNSLRKFRDLHLKKYEAGRAFIRYYYEYGPVAAAAIKKRERLKSLIRLCLLPLMYAGRNFDAVLLALKALLAFSVFVLIWYAYARATRIPTRNKRIPVIY
jgi:hypothetical protein